MSELLQDALRFLDGADALIDTPHPTDDDQRRARANLAEAVERITAAMLPTPTTTDAEEATSMTEITYLDRPEDLPPHRVSWGIVGGVTNGGHQFPLKRDDYVDQVDGPNFTSHIVDVGPLGQVDVERSGQEGDGPWSVDPYRPGEVSTRMTSEEARRFAHAILGAADLADQLNGEGVQP